MENNSFRRPTINSAELIHLVKMHPCLYDNRGVHGNHELKNAAWGEIGTNMFQDEWHEFSLQEKDQMVKDLQVKWKNLRDNFSRQLRLIEQAKAGIGALPGRKYVFLEKLRFLTPFINKREKFTVSTEDSKDSNDSMFELEEQKPFRSLSMSDSNDTTPTPQQTYFVPIKPKPAATKATIKPVQITTLTTTAKSDSSDEPPSKKIALCLSELVALQKEERAEDTMGNKKFLLSLLPFMKKLPDDVNLEVRLQLMSVLQTYSGGKGLQS